MQDQQLRHSRLQRKGGSLLEPGDAVQFAEVCLVLIDCLNSGGDHAGSVAPAAFGGAMPSATRQ
jgi:hypothetical protein